MRFSTSVTNSVLSADEVLSFSSSSSCLGLRDLIKKRKWDLVPEPASLWWTSTYEEEERSEVGTYCHPWTDVQNSPLRRNSSLGCAMNRQGKTLDAIEERMQSANKSLLEGHSGLQEQTCAVEDQVQKIGGPRVFRLLFGCANWSCTIQTMDRIKKWETKIMMRLFRFKRGKDETWVEFHTRCCKAARKNGYRWADPFCMKQLLKACGELWDGMCSEANCSHRFPEADFQVEKFSVVACHTY